MSLVRSLSWSLLAFLCFGAPAFAAIVTALLRAWWRQRREAVRWAMDPVRRLRK